MIREEFYNVIFSVIIAIVIVIFLKYIIDVPCVIIKKDDFVSL